MKKPWHSVSGARDEKLKGGETFLSHTKGVIDVDKTIDKKRKAPKRARATWYGGASAQRPHE